MTIKEIENLLKKIISEGTHLVCNPTKNHFELRGNCTHNVYASGTCLEDTIGNYLKNEKGFQF